MNLVELFTKWQNDEAFHAACLQGMGGLLNALYWHADRLGKEVENPDSPIYQNRVAAAEAATLLRLFMMTPGFFPTKDEFSSIVERNYPYRPARLAEAVKADAKRHGMEPAVARIWKLLEKELGAEVVSEKAGINQETYEKWRRRDARFSHGL